MSFWLMQTHIGVVEGNHLFSIHVIFQEHKIYIMDSLYTPNDVHRVHVYVLVQEFVLLVLSICFMFLSLFGNCCSCNICNIVTGFISPFGKFVS